MDSPAGLDAALSGGADRIELCSALALGGLTPTPGLMARAAGRGIPIMVMVRPRPGDFVMSQADLSVARAEIAIAREAGMQGVVIGASRPDGRLDEWALSQLASEAEGMEITLHRAFDLVPDQKDALEIVRRLGISRVLTSGGALRAVDGLDRLAEAVHWSFGEVSIMPGSGVDVGSVGDILAAVDVRDVHASCSEEVVVDADVAAMGLAAPVIRRTSADKVRALKKVLLAAA